MGDLVTYVGHATVRLELAGVSLLTDPLLRGRFLHVTRAAAPPAPATLERLDALLVSHLHPDHLDFPSIRALDRDLDVFVPAGGERLFRRRGFNHVTGLVPGDTATVRGLEIAATVAVHDGRRYPVGPPVRALGFDVRGSSRVYFAGDTDLFEGMERLRGADLALLPIGGWGPRVRAGHLDAVRAAAAAAMIRPRIVVPIHWGTYLRAGLNRTRPELLTEPPRGLAAEISKRAPDVDLRVLAPGESLEL